jgi:hypothetical protein
VNVQQRVNHIGRILQEPGPSCYFYRELPMGVPSSFEHDDLSPVGTEIRLCSEQSRTLNGLRLNYELHTFKSCSNIGSRDHKLGPYSLVTTWLTSRTLEVIPLIFCFDSTLAIQKSQFPWRHLCSRTALLRLSHHPFDMNLTSWTVVPLLS